MYRKEIVWDRETKDYGMYLDGELVGFARTYHEAEVTLDQLVFELIGGPRIDPEVAVYTDTMVTECSICGEYKDEDVIEVSNDGETIVCHDCRAALIADEIETQRTLRIYARPAEPADVLYSCPCLSASSPDGAVDNTPRTAPDAPLAGRQARILAFCTRCGAPGTTTDPDADYVCPACLATPATSTLNVNAGWDAEDHPDNFAAVAAQILAPLTHLRPSVNDRGDYLLAGTSEKISTPCNDHAVMCLMIDALNAVAAQLPVRPTSITAHMHIGSEHYSIGHNGPPLAPAAAPLPVEPHDPAATLRPLIAMVLDEWKELGAATPYDAALAQLDRETQQACAPPASDLAAIGAAHAVYFHDEPARFFAQLDTLSGVEIGEVMVALGAFWGEPIEVVAADLTRTRALLTQIAA